MTDQPQNVRGLKALVGIMAVLIIIGTTVVIGTVIHRLYASFNTPPMPLKTSVPSFLPSKLIPLTPVRTLAAGEHIIQITSTGSDIAILLSTPQGQKLLLLNPATSEIKTLLTSP